ncbi:hypothetical protein MTR_3g065520 [Medicago truncatula]|uniref:Uncharacterized protein n=1 Tax=Medicago truncatula TaxID=3880 RepID=G7J9D8_MEDTR|nr:hypothetical protein MTR_3g065520 [Medicago truncatula]
MQGLSCLSVRRLETKCNTTWKVFVEIDGIGISSNGRALALHARGTGFDPPHLQRNSIF